MARPIVYGPAGSTYVWSARLALAEKGVAHDLVDVPFGAHREAPHLARHPFAKVPAFEHDGFALYETQAILRYIDEGFPASPLQPTDLHQFARMNQIIGIIEWYFFPKAAAPIAFNRIIGPKLLGLPTDEVAIAEAMPMARTCFEVLDGLLGDQAYFGGEQISIADIMMAAQLDLLCETPEGAGLIADTRLVSWLERMKSRPSFVATQPPAMLREAA